MLNTETTMISRESFARMIGRPVDIVVELQNGFAFRCSKEVYDVKLSTWLTTLDIRSGRPPGRQGHWFGVWQNEICILRVES